MNGSNGYAVRADSLTRKFGDFTAVNAISFEVNRGEIFGFLGANGAGKTTAIRMLCGLLAPTSGDAWVGGHSVLSEAETVKRTIGYMSQKFSLYDDLLVRENLEFYGGVYGLDRDEIKARSNEILDNLGLHRFYEELTGEMPLGFKQRLALGCAMIHDPNVLFLDEPTSGVDPIARRSFWDLIYDVARGGTTVFVTTHYMDEAEYCSRVSIMVDGRIEALDSPAELKRQTGERTMQNVFLSLVER